MHNEKVMISGLITKIQIFLYRNEKKKNQSVDYYLLF